MIEKPWYKKWWGIFFILWGLAILSTIAIQQLSKVNQTFKEGSEPDGFRNIKWGTKLESLQNMEHIGTRDDFGEETSLYIKTDDELIIGGAALEKIVYGFWNNKLFEVRIDTNGYRDCTALKESAIERFGEGKHKEKNTVELIEWTGDKAIASFRAFTSDICSLTIFSYDIYEELIDNSRQKSKDKAEEGAEKGF
jgi:hypothetical protein